MQHEQHQSEFTDDELKQLIEDPRFTPEDLLKLSTRERSRLQQMKINANAPGLTRLFQKPPTLDHPQPLEIDPIGDLVGGPYEQAFAAPGGLLGMLAPARLLAAPVAAGGGAIGAFLDDPSLSHALGGAVRQMVLELLGAGIRGPMARRLAKEAVRGISDEAAEVVLSPRSRLDLRPVGRSEAGAVKYAERAGQRVGQRIAHLPPAATTPREQLLEGSNALMTKLSGQTMKQPRMRSELANERNEMLAGTPKHLTPAQVQEIKKGARRGFEGLQRKRVANAPVTPATELEALSGDNAQKILETIDATQRAGRPVWQSLINPTLRQLNKKSGAAIELRRAIAEGKHEGNFFRRWLAGSLAGAAANVGLRAAQGESPLPDLSGGGQNAVDAFARYSLPGVMGGLGFGLFPGGLALGTRAAGSLLPTATRAGLLASGLYDPKSPLGKRPIKLRKP